MQSVKMNMIKQCMNCAEEARRTHNRTKTPLYKVWTGMKQRCLNTNANRYDRYGGRGIQVCSEWQNSFEVFEKWMLENGYKNGLTIDRKNNDGNYNPLNCRLCTMAEQNENKTYGLPSTGEQYIVKKRNKFSITIKGSIYIGVAETLEEAIQLRNNAMKEHHDISYSQNQ